MELLLIYESALKKGYEDGVKEAINVCKVMQSKAETSNAYLHACEIEEAIAELLDESV